MTAGTASQRTLAIREAKFPRKSQVIPYGRCRRFLPSFLATNKYDVAALDEEIEHVKLKAKNELNDWKRAEYKRNQSALEVLKETLTKLKSKKFLFSVGPADHTLLIEEVRINSRADPIITFTEKDGTLRSGGCVTFFAATKQARRNIEERRKLVAAILHWSMQDAGGNIVPLEKLCIAYDVFGGEITSAPKAIDKLRANIRGSCKEAAKLWDGVAPPNDYDGPDWES
jgi:hypothetical protein